MGKLSDSEVEGALQARDMWATTVLRATSDNGAVPMEVLNTQAGSNWPLRGQKFRTYEGGTKVPAFLYSALLPAAPRGSTYAGLVHIVDVAPNHSGIVMGMACSVSVLPSFMSNMIPQVCRAVL